ncbi:hypothetical protein B0T26DRAFT_718080 [Lasiosphaeria miniovina]|uniref:Uncharacterized protein n=1 Tax=Lasiosphaeria miniovina TaxID=1954250 RepID=A0AA40AD18_9PEZI|nr:uncharacterized protein B0T26DRAFT_718080 [Lasiosphaeria miniovina]KAK0713669.1 hypothetical protein B0T26DRAFT_718080 [Lasiosphaeria miniovina]
MPWTFLYAVGLVGAAVVAVLVITAGLAAATGNCLKGVATTVWGDLGGAGLAFVLAGSVLV